MLSVLDYVAILKGFVSLFWGVTVGVVVLRKRKFWPEREDGSSDYQSAKNGTEFWSRQQ